MQLLARQKLHRVAATKIAYVNGPLEKRAPADLCIKIQVYFTENCRKKRQR